MKSNGYWVLGDFENPLVKECNNTQGFDFFRPLKSLNKQQIKEIEYQTGIQNIGWNKSFHISSNYDRLYDMLLFLLEYQGDKPFYLVKWFYDPHAPYNPPQKFRKRINPDFSRLNHPIEFYNTLRVSQSRKLNPYEKSVYFKELYKAEVESMDERVGFLIKALKKKNLLKNTLIIFTSDHGDLFGEHNKYGHTGAFYQPLVHIPLIFSGPGIPKGKRIKTTVTHLDLMPSLWHIARRKENKDCQGSSYSSLFDNKNIAERSPYFDSYNNRTKKNTKTCDALIHRNIKLIGNKKKSQDQWQLFDLSADPSELNDISSQKPLLMKFMLKKIMRIRKNIELIKKKNTSEFTEHEKKLNLKWEKTEETLKSLGYIE